jgi:hypothetical protein
MPTNPTTSHKKGLAHYKKKKYSYASVRAHVTDAMKFNPEAGADDALKAIQNHAKQIVKNVKKDIDAGDEDLETFEHLFDWECVLECVTEARTALDPGVDIEIDATTETDPYKLKFSKLFSQEQAAFFEAGEEAGTVEHF